MRRSRLSVGLFCVVVLGISILVQGCKEPQERFFIPDAYGRALILHGVNVIGGAKNDPLHVGSYTQEDIQRLSRDWGFNFVRFLVFWNAIEPEQGVFDETYLDRVAERLEWCRAAGIAVVLDMHQDLYAPRFGGDGAPEWAIEDNGWPFEHQEPWELNYIQPAVLAAITNFWDYGNPRFAYLQEHYTQSVMKVVERFHTHPAVIGYDLYNEPFIGLCPLATFESQVLKPFYDRLITQIRTVDDEKWIFYEPLALGVNQSIFPSTLGTIADPRPGEPRLAYFPHIYTLDLDVSGKYIGNPSMIKTWEAYRRAEIQKQKAPLLIGEFGLNGSLPGANDYIGDVLDMADRIGSGWAYWSYDRGSWGLTDNEGREQPKVNALVRPYPRCVAGQPLRYGYDTAARTFSLTFREAGILAPTEIYIPARRFYPEGWQLSVSDPYGAWRSEWDPASEILKVYTDPSQSRHAITIRPAG